MTREEAIRCLEICKKYIDKIRASEGVEVSREVCMALDMAVKALEAWEKVIDAINNLDEHDYCRCEGANIPPMIDKEDVLNIINMNLSEVEK